MNKYESIFIFKPDLDEKQLQEECSKAEEVIKKQEGKIEKSEQWGRKKLAYVMKNFSDGLFVYMQFEAPPLSIRTLTEAFKIDNNILRAQITRKEK